MNTKRPSIRELAILTAFITVIGVEITVPIALIAIFVRFLSSGGLDSLLQVSQAPASSAPAVIAVSPSSHIGGNQPGIPGGSSPTPTEVNATLPGFDRVEILPNDIFMLSAPAPANVIQSIAVPLGGGGGGIPCWSASEPAVYHYTFDPGSAEINLCGLNSHERIQVTLRQPSGSLNTFSFNVKDDGSYRLCFPPQFVLDAGKYQFDVLSSQPHNAQAGDFEVRPDPNLSLYARQPDGSLSCDMQISISPGKPTYLLYAAFSPNEQIEMILYKYRGNPPTGVGDYVSSWSFVADENGRAAQLIKSPQIPYNELYILFAIGSSSAKEETWAPFPLSLSRIIRAIPDSLP